MSYFTATNGIQEGPFTEEQLRQKLGLTINSQTLIWKEGMANWAPLGEVLPGLASGSAISTGIPSFSGLAPSSTPASAKGWELAPLLSRFLAALIDISPFFIIGIICAVLIPVIAAASKDQESSTGAILVLVFVGLAVLAVGCVQLYMLVQYSQTIGKKLLGIRIYDFATGLPANWIKTILLRIFVNALPSMIPFIGGFYGIVDICFIFRQDRRCIHDLIAGTVVGTVPK